MGPQSTPYEFGGMAKALFPGRAGTETAACRRSRSASETREQPAQPEQPPRRRRHHKSNVGRKHRKDTTERKERKVSPVPPASLTPVRYPERYWVYTKSPEATPAAIAAGANPLEHDVRHVRAPAAEDVRAATAADEPRACPPPLPSPSGTASRRGPDADNADHADSTDHAEDHCRSGDSSGRAGRRHGHRRHHRRSAAIGCYRLLSAAKKPIQVRRL
jgi:hypothetical protein